MTIVDDELLSECKKGLGISADSSAFDGLLKQKLLAVKTFMLNAGVPESKFDELDPLAVGVIVMGVADLWELQGGNARFSPVFTTLLSQLTYGNGGTV
jgi:hypothetical protein